MLRRLRRVGDLGGALLGHALVLEGLVLLLVLDARTFVTGHSGSPLVGFRRYRLRRATAAPCLPSAVRVLGGMLAIDRFCCAPARAFLTFRLAARTWFAVAMVTSPLPVRAGHCSSSRSRRSALGHR